MIERRLNIALPKMLAEAETDRQIENDVDIRTGLTTSHNRGWAELHQLAGALIQSEANPQPLALPGAGNWQDDIGTGSCRCQVEVALDMKFEAAQRLGPAHRVSVRQRQRATAVC
jgi:hypothetical protein